MTPAPTIRLSDLSVSTLVAGLIAMLTGYTSSLVLMIQAGQAAHLTDPQISSWIWALSIGMGVTTLGLSLAMRVPIVVAWSTPGAALLIASLPGVPYPEAIGAFLMAALLMTAAGLTGWFDKLMKALPASIASALLAGILFRISVDVFVQAQHQTALLLAMFAAYLIGRRWWPRYAVPGVLAVGVVLAGAMGQLHFEQFHFAVALPVWTTPSFSLAAFVSIAVPLFIVALASQNIPGLAVLRADGYLVPASPLIAVTGIASAVLAPFGSHGVNLAAITAAICTGPQADADPRRRYMAAVVCGVGYLVMGVMAASIAALFAAFPKALVVAVAAFALLGSIANGLTVAMQTPAERESALLTFMITASGMTLAGVGSAFWGVVGGMLALLVLKPREPKAA
ncbi:benzoate/H(+) symporter BenE family transporter [Cupriavidus sp.]|uniref:benzoate/H(+) symporter BenE family transporter n=2 Tax=unclassified Cupriavidus TaxID=2640874 RepID=UPI0025B9309B|nr:benzoate/H(+) symporter BenE family transporter [Cupriavidus sp.]MCA3186336.1 benzoate/H(+) symporter BenE family transporter [Cupriavidus sp.]MCA3192643.1 benzoate/H(+) symporter BenE family transporter [Cupriavidus sp.]MCA3194844.1 benzoate/H(+) symporter BenE family transporter [Cupriavidus sp.]MCA3200482.1 benzoate/H(+) symporter BenE family transporter [Cupriavidus sp.]MCA3209170.1 benzoate/H(+) symporter BenE family transporter [Cupriavidus sp.]